MSKKICYLHIGYPKTGTTSIQNACHNSDKLLRNEGCIYPRSGLFGTGHHYLAAQYVGKQSSKAWVPKTENKWSDLNQEISKGESKSMILSSELFGFVDDFAGLKSELSDYDVKIIVFFRPQMEWMESAYTQLLKFGMIDRNSTIIQETEGRIRNGRLNYYRFLKPWADVFGKEAIKVATYQRSSEKNWLLKKWWNAIGLGDSQIVSKVKKENANPSIAPICVEFMSRICTPENTLLNGRVQSYMEEYTNTIGNSKEKLYRMSLEKIEYYSKVLDESNRQVAIDYLGREELFHKNNQLQYRPYPTFSDEELWSVALWLIQRLIEDIDSAGVEWKKQNSWIKTLTQKLNNLNK